jgi:hypothetical protein
MAKALDSGESLILFPEGTRNTTDAMLLPFRSGLYHLSRARPHVELVPTWIDNLGRVLPKGAAIPLPLLCSVSFGVPLILLADEPKADFLARAREALLARGGAARSNVFTRIALALFGHVPWRAVPFVPVEIMLLPKWFPFHLSKVSYWTRTVLVPLTVLCSLKARARNPTGKDVRELFAVPPEKERRWFQLRSPLNRVLLGVERTARLFEPLRTSANTLTAPQAPQQPDCAVISRPNSSARTPPMALPSRWMLSVISAS